MGRSGGGGGGGRSFGGFSGGGRSSGSFSGGGRSGGRGGFSSGGRAPGGFGGGWMGGPRPPHFGGGYWRRPPMGGYPPPMRQSGCGTVASVLLIFVIILVVAAFSFLSSFSSSNITKSTVAREPLPAGSVTETQYYTDEPGWIGSKTKLLAGMKSFYKQTGIQPYLYIAEEVNGSAYPSSQQLTDYAETLYDDLFTDEAHFLLVFFDDGAGNYHCGYSAGTMAKTVMDDEAVGILADYLDRYYYSDSMEDEEFFSTVFEKTAERMMTVTKSPWPTVLIVVAVAAAVVLLVVLLYRWWKRAKEQKNLEAKQTQDMLNTPLEQFGDLEAEELAKKYSDEPKEQ